MVNCTLLFHCQSMWHLVRSRVKHDQSNRQWTEQSAAPAKTTTWVHHRFRANAAINQTVARHHLYKPFFFFQMVERKNAVCLQITLMRDWDLGSNSRLIDFRDAFNFAWCIFWHNSSLKQCAFCSLALKVISLKVMDPGHDSCSWFWVLVAADTL